MPADFAKLEKDAREKIKRQESYIKNLLKGQLNIYENMQDDYLNTIAWCYDPHTDYMSLKRKKNLIQR